MPDVHRRAGNGRAPVALHDQKGEPHGQPLLTFADVLALGTGDKAGTQDHGCGQRARGARSAGEGIGVAAPHRPGAAARPRHTRPGVVRRRSGRGIRARVRARRDPMRRADRCNGCKTRLQDFAPRERAVVGLIHPVELHGPMLRMACRITSIRFSCRGRAFRRARTPADGSSLSDPLMLRRACVPPYRSVRAGR
jgi:hypothetical protein